MALKKIPHPEEAAKAAVSKDATTPIPARGSDEVVDTHHTE
jgi:hypothetical protein